MAGQPLSAVVQFLQTMRVQEAAECSDAELLAGFAAHHAPTALEALVRRHGHMVLGVCRRVLGAGPDADDAFQATFLVLARKASTIRKRHAAGSWLHGVALHLSHQTRAKLASQRRRETNLGAAMDSIPTHADPEREINLRELGSILDEELERLPTVCRAAIVACHLENRSTTRAAKHLGIPASTLKSRLDRGRELLRGRLIKRGVGLSAVTLAVSLTEQGRAWAAPALVRATVEAAVDFASSGAAAVSAQVASLAANGLKVAPLMKVKLVLIGSLAVGLAGLAATVPAPFASTENGPIKAASKVVQPTDVAMQQRKAAKDVFDDPLPPGAVARLGTVRWRHDGPPDYVAILPDGKTVITSGDTAIHVWARDSGKELRRFQPSWAEGNHPPRFPSNVAAVSKDGKLVAGFWNESVIHLWETETGKALPPIPLGKDAAPAAGLAFSPDGKKLAVSSMAGGVRIWDFAAAKTVSAFGSNPPNWPGDNFKMIWQGALAYGPDGRSVVSIVRDMINSPHLVTLTVWDPATGQVQRKLEEPLTSSPASPVFSPDGKLFAYATNKEACVFDLAADRMLFKQEAREGAGWGPKVGFSADSERLYFLPGKSRLIYEYEAKTGKLLRELGTTNGDRGIDSYRTAAYAMTVSPDGDQLAICDVGNSVRFVEIGSGKDLLSNHGHMHTLNYLTYSADGKWLLTSAADHTLRCWDAATGKQLKLLPTPPKSHYFVPSADGNYIVSQLENSTALELFDTAKGQVVASLAVQPSTSTSFFLSPDGRTLFVYQESDGNLVLHDIPTLKERCRIAADTQTSTVRDSPKQTSSWFLPLTFFFSTDSKRLAGRQESYGMGIWDVATGKLLQRLKLTDGILVHGGVFSPDGRAIALVLDDGTIPVFELASGQQRATLGERPDLKTDQGKGNRLVRTGRFHRAFNVTNSNWLAFSPDSRLLADHDPDNALRIWDVATSQELAKLSGHHGGIYAVAFAPDGNTVATGSSDSTALIWDLKALRAKARPKPRDLEAAALEACWTALATNDAIAAYAAINQLAAAPNQAVPFFKGRLQPAMPVDGARVGKLIGLLDDADYKTREKAGVDLIQLGEQVVFYLTKALAKDNSLEMKRRIEGLLERLAAPPWSGERLREVRAVEALERIGTAEACSLMQTLADGAPGAVLTDNARRALRQP
jgi:RNA polymerase sigma factor (sigma-70 family)